MEYTMEKTACLHDRENEGICRKSLSAPGKSHAKCLRLHMPAASQSPMVASVYLPHPLSLPQVAASLFPPAQEPTSSMERLPSIRQPPLLPLGREPNLSTRGQV